jgi:hypothetical protein
MGTSAFVLAGPAGTYDNDIDATHLMRLVEGDRAVWRVTTLHGKSLNGQTHDLVGWWPAGADRITADLYAVLAVAVLGATTSLAVDRGAISPSDADNDEIERLATLARQAPGLSVAAAALPGSTLDIDRLGESKGLGPLALARLTIVADTVD